MTVEEMNRVARAIWLADGEGNWEKDKEKYRRMAKAAIKEIRYGRTK